MGAASWQEVVASAPAAFLLGVFVGWLVSQRYAVVRRRDPVNGQRARRDYDKE